MDTNTSLLNDAKRMNRDALAQIFNLYAPALYNYSLRFCRDPLLADHIVGDVFAKFLDLMAIGKGPTTNLRSYLFQIAYHLLIDEVRYSNSKTSIEKIDFIRYSEHSVFSDIEKRMLYETLYHAIWKDLTDYQRHVIILRFLEGFNLHETAAILGKSVNVIKAAQHHAITTLRRVVGDQDVEAGTVSPS